jgi:hypothetical protein
MRLRQRTAEDGEVFGKHVDSASVDRAPTGHHAITGYLGLLHSKIGATVLDEHVEFLEGALIEKKIDPLASRELAAPVLGIDARLTAALPRIGAALFKLGEYFLHFVMPLPAVLPACSYLPPSFGSGSLIPSRDPGSFSASRSGDLAEQ